MKRLNKKQCAQLDELHQKVENAVLVLNTARQEFEEFREDLKGQMDDYLAERSDTWIEGERGMAYQEWVDQWEEPICDEAQVDIDIECYPESPEEC